jgi:hypothetical protein
MASAQTYNRNTQPLTIAPVRVNLFVLLCLLFVSMCARAADAKVTHPHWIIILTITDLTTGVQLEQLKLDSRLRFDDPIECRSIVAEMGHIPTGDHFDAALTCRKVAANGSEYISFVKPDCRPIHELTMRIEANPQAPRDGDEAARSTLRSDKASGRRPCQRSCAPLYLTSKANMFGDSEIRQFWSDEDRTQHHLDWEAALACTQAGLGRIPIRPA